MKVVCSENYDIHLTGHPWDTDKYRNIANRLLAAKLINEDNIIRVDWADDEDVLRVHTLDYVEKMNQMSFTREDERRLELSINESLVRLFWTFAEGTITACHHAMNDGICVHLGGGMHHAFASYGSGFCMVNDLAIAARHMQAESPVNNVLIVDCDLHQGDGTAKLFNGDPAVFTFSIHQRDLFPYFKQESDLDIELESGTGDEEYLEKLSAAIDQIFDGTRSVDLIIYQAGADPYADDPLGRLELSIEGLRQRDQLIIRTAKEHRIPIAITLGGGYSDNVVDIHCNMVRAALEISQ